MTRAILLLPLLFAISNAALAADAPKSDPVTAAAGFASHNRVIGSGRIVDDRRGLTGFTAIRASGPVDVELKAASRDSVTVHADDNVTPLIQTRLLGGDHPILEISMQPLASLRPSQPPRVLVEFQMIEDIAMSGSGSLRAGRIKAEIFALSMTGSGSARIATLETGQFAAVLAGSGDLVIGGHADEQAYKLDGSGDVNAAKLRGRNVKIAISGSGDAFVSASEALEVQSSGSGDVVYTGSPRLTKRVRGSGEVRRKP